jgi:hypothetical protein
MQSVLTFAPMQSLLPLKMWIFFPMIVKILGLKSIPSDGDMRVLNSILLPTRRNSRSSRTRFEPQIAGKIK